MRDEEVNVSEPDKDVALKDTKTQKKKGEKERKAERIIKFSFVFPGVVLFCGGIKWNGEVKKKYQPQSV